MASHPFDHVTRSRRTRFLLLVLASLTLLAWRCDHHVDHDDDGSSTARLAVSEYAVVGPGLTLRFDRVVSDSRCPSTAVCVWAGEATVALTLSGPRGVTPFLLSTLSPSASVDGYEVKLLVVDPYPEVSGPIPAGHYRITVRVTR